MYGLQKQLKHLHLRQFDRVRLKGARHSMLGTITTIELDINKINFQGERAMFIEVTWDSNGVHWYAPGQLKKVKS